MNKLFALYQSTQTIPERQEKVSCCTKVSKAGRTLLSIPAKVRDAVTWPLAKGTVCVFKGIYSMMPGCVQRRYQSHCLKQAANGVEKLPMGKAATSAVSAASGFLGSFLPEGATSFARSLGEITGLQSLTDAADTFDGRGDEVALKRYVVPLIHYVHEYAAVKGVQMAYNLAVDGAVMGVTVLAPALKAHSYLQTALLGIETTTALYTYGPTAHKAAVLGMTICERRKQYLEIQSVFRTQFGDVAKAVSEATGVSQELILQTTGMLVVDGNILLLSCFLDNPETFFNRVAGMLKGFSS